MTWAFSSRKADSRANPGACEDQGRAQAGFSFKPHRYPLRQVPFWVPLYRWGRRGTASLGSRKVVEAGFKVRLPSSRAQGLTHHYVTHTEGLRTQGRQGCPRGMFSVDSGHSLAVCALVRSLNLSLCPCLFQLLMALAPHA